MQQVRNAIRAGTFKFADFFPDSPRAKAEAPARRSFKSICDLYLQSIGQLSEATRSQYRNAIENVWLPMLGAGTDFDRITHEMLAAKIGSTPWKSGKSCNNYLIPLRGVFGLIYRGPRAAENPMLGLKNAATVKRKPDPLSAAERDKILEDMARHYDERVVAYFRFAFFTGMRPEEMIALRWTDIDWASGVARVQRVRTFKGSERDGTKTHTVRDVDLTEPALAALQVMKPYTYLKTKAEGDIFEHPVEGKPWHDDRAQRDTFWKPSLRRAGVRLRRAYCTRHTFATVTLMAGIKPAYIAAQLGHSLQMLLSTYTRWMPESDGGTERDRLRAIFADPNSSQGSPRAVVAGNEKPGKPLISNSLPGSDVGRRDWTRTSTRGKRG